MKKALIVGLILSCFPLVAVSITFNIVGDDDFPPFSFIDQDKQVRGVDVDLMYEMADRLGIKLNIELVPWKRLLSMTKNGDIAGSFSLFKTPEREAFAHFTYPVHYSTYKLFTVKSNPVRFENLKDLYGKRIGLSAGFVISDEFDAARVRGDINVVEIYHYDDAFRRLFKGGVDAFVANELVVNYKLKNEYSENKAFSDIVSLAKPLKQSRGGFFVLSKKFPMKDKLKWQARFTDTLMMMEQDGIAEKFIQKYKH